MSKDMTKVEMSHYFFACPFQAKHSNICFCTCHGRPTRQAMTLMRSCVVSYHFDEKDCDIVLHHCTPYISKLCNHPVGIDFLKSVIVRASDVSIGAFIAEAPIKRMILQHYDLIETLLYINKGAHAGAVVDRIAGDFVAMATNPRANYPIQSLCDEIPLKQFHTIMKVISPHVSMLSIHPHGAYVLQTVIRRVTLHFKEIRDEYVKDALEKMLRSVVDLGPKVVLHPNGNFTAQEMIQSFNLYKSVLEMFTQDVCTNLVQYVTSDIGTRVVELFLEQGSFSAQKYVVDAFLKLDDADFERCLSLEWGAYVLRKMRRCASLRQEREIRRRLRYV